MYRRVYEVAYTTRERYRKTKRSLEDSIKLARIARELTPLYVRILEWNDEKKVLEVEI